MPRKKKEKLLGGGMKADLLKQFIDLSYKGNTSIAPEGYEIDAPLSDSRVKVYKKIGSNQVIVTHRGSVGLQDWWDNAKFLVAGKVKNTKSYKMHRERHLKAVEKYGAENIIGIGHSRAGLYLQELQKEVPIKEIITYNKAVGFYDALRENPAEQTDVKVKNDFVSLLSGLQKRPNKMVEIDATSNPLDFNKAHQPAEIEKLGDTFIGKKEEIEGGKLTNPFYTPLPIVAVDFVGRKTGLFGSGTAPKSKTEAELKKLLTKLEKQKENIKKGKVYKTTNLDKVNYAISYIEARLLNYATKGEDLIITKKKKYGDEVPRKAKAYKAKVVKPKEVKPEPKKEEPKPEPKKEEPKKEEPKKEEPKKEEINPKLAKIEEFINDTENYLNKKSTRAFNAFMKKYDDKNFIKSIIGAQKFSDFYPTSQKCLSNYSIYLKNIDEDDIILEPTAGLGSIVLWLLKNNVKSKIIATDFDPNINKYLKESFDGINQVTVLDHVKSDYLTMKNDYYKYNPSVIFLNPPFSNKGDKKYYLNFLFKALYDLNESENPIRERKLFFISPQLTNKNEKNDQVINFEDIVISANKKKEIKNMLNINNEDEWENLMPNQIVKVNSCKDFGGTNVEAVLYHIITFGNPSQKSEKEEPKKEEPKKEEPKPKPPKIKRQKAFLLEYKEVKEEPKPKEVKKEIDLNKMTKAELITYYEKIREPNLTNSLKSYKKKDLIFYIQNREKELKEEPKPKEVKEKKVKEEVKPVKPLTKKARLENFTKIFMTKDIEIINKILKIMINKVVNGLEDAKYRKKILNVLIKTDAGYPSTFKFKIEDFLALYYKNNCGDFMCKYGINSKDDYKKWIVKNHPDKGGTIDKDEFIQVMDCAKESKYCEEKEPMTGGGFNYLDEISDPTNPIYSARSNENIPSIVEPEDLFLMGGAFTDMAGMNCNKEDGSCFNPVWEKQKIKRQILSEYKIWYNPFAPPPAGTIRMAWLQPMIEERYKPLYDEFVARRNVNIGLPADASKDRFAQQMFSNLTDGLSYVPGSNLATIGLTAASALSDTKKGDGT